MTAKLRVPTYLQASTDVGGPARVEWLAALPERVEELTARWGLDLGEPFEPGGNCSWVAPGTDLDGREVVLKVAWQHTEALHEAEGLAALGGRGAVEVYAFEHLPGRPGGGPETDTTAMLLERCRPGTELPRTSRGRAARRHHRPAAVGLGRRPAVRPPVPSAVGDGRRLGGAAPRRGWPPTRNGSTPGSPARGWRCSASCRAPGGTEVLLFTDLHAGNVLSGQRRPWLLIDPKPYVGDPHYDVLQHLLNCNGSLQADPIGLLTEVADLAGLDAARVRQWLFARCVQESLGDGPPWPGLDVVLRRLGGP